MADTDSVVASSRIRLARNLNGYPFPSRLKNDKQAKEIIRAVSSAINKVDEFRLYYMDGIPEEQALNLVENHLVSPLLLKRPSYSAVLINESRNVSIMINEEDHLREQCIEKGYALRSAYATMSQKDGIIAHSIQFAYDEQLGFLTACPTNLGTGLRASVMLFLPALTTTGWMPRVIRSANRLGLTVRGVYGEGSDADGYMYQLSNEVTLGLTEEFILSQVEQVVERLPALLRRADKLRHAFERGMRNIVRKPHTRRLPRLLSVRRHRLDRRSCHKNETFQSHPSHTQTADAGRAGRLPCRIRFEARQGRRQKKYID